MTNLMYKLDKYGRQTNIVVGQMSGQTNIGHTNINQTNVGRTKLEALFQVTSVLCLTSKNSVIANIFQYYKYIRGH
jgi:hypothetical protein